MNKPPCFVLMPFGKKPNGIGGVIDFDAVYEQLIRPAIEKADLQPIRADEEQTGGVIHKPMFERLLLCPHAVADLTTANANVFYELGVRHAMRPHTTALIFAEGIGQLPFDVGLLRALPYQLGPGGVPTNVEDDCAALAAKLEGAKQEAVDSPLYQMLEGYPAIDHTKTDVFRERVVYAETLKGRLAAARKQGVVALRTIEQEIGPLQNAEAGVIVDLFLSYRAVEAWTEMIRLAEAMPKPLAATVMVQEQLALALNRAERGDEAERVLLELIERRGPSSETLGILGRVYKDRWEAAVKAGQTFLAEGHLDRAIDAYRRGFEADWRDAYPGINAVTLMEIRDPPEPDREGLLPVVRYAVERRMASGKPDYWDHATLLELAVLARDGAAAGRALGRALASIRETWEPATTLRNLRLIREARERRGDTDAWAGQLEQAMVDAKPARA